MDSCILGSICTENEYGYNSIIGSQDYKNTTLQK